MKKFLLALSILSVVPYSTTSCSQNNNDGGGNGGVILLVAVTLGGGYVVGKYVIPYISDYFSATPADQPQQQSDNNSSELPKNPVGPKIIPPYNQPLSFENKGNFEKPQNDTSKPNLLERKEDPKSQPIVTKPGASKHTQKPVSQAFEPKRGESNPDFWTHLRNSARQNQTKKFLDNACNNPIVD